MSLDLKGLLSITIYSLIGPALIIMNQYIMKSLNFPYPIFLSGLGVAMSGIVAKILVATNYITLKKMDEIEGVLWYKRVLPVGLSFAATLSFGNMVYLYLDIGFIQMLKSFTPVFILLTGYLCGVETMSIPMSFSVLLISFGTATTCSATSNLNLIGLFIMFLSSLSEAIRLVITQYFLQNLKFGIIETQYVLSPASAFWLFLTSAVFEFPRMMKNNSFQTVIDNPMAFFMASLAGVGVNYISYFVIQYTSSLSIKIYGTMRNILMVFIGIFCYSEVVTSMQAIGYIISLFGFAGYNMVQMGYFNHNSPNKDVEVASCAEPSSPSALPMHHTHQKTTLPLKLAAGSHGATASPARKDISNLHLTSHHHTANVLVEQKQLPLDIESQLGKSENCEKIF